MTRRFLLGLVLIYVVSVTVPGSIIMLYNNDPKPVEYFVNATGGSNSNSCTAARTVGTPKATIGGASGGISCLSAGQILTVKSGIYVENDIGLNAPTIPSGTSDDIRTVVRAAAGETVTIRPSGGTGALFIYSKNYISIESIIFDAVNVAGAGMYVGRSSTANTASSNITLESVEIKNAPASGVYFGHNQDTVTTNGGFKALNCLMHDNGAVTSGHGIYSQTRGALIDGGAYYSNTSHGVHVYCHGAEVGGNAWTGCTDTTVRNVEAKNNGTVGIGLYNGSNISAYNNLVHNNGAVGIAARFGCNACKIYNNTLYSNGTTGGIYITSTVAGNNSSTGAVVRNNILFQNDGTEMVDEGVSTVVSNSLCETGCFVNETVAANIFTDIANNDFSLVPTSPAINQGFNLSSTFTTDYAGNTRVVPFDIGAYESVSAVELTQVSVPNGAELWVKGTQQTIEWSSSNVIDVSIKVDRGNDGVFEETITASTPSDGTYDWTPGGTSNANCKIQICDATDGTPCDTSNAVFSIVDAPGTTLTKIISENTVGSFIGDIPGVEETALWSDQATTNFASGNIVMNKSAVGSNNTLLRFTGLSQIPTNAVVNSVTVGLNLQTFSGTAGTATFDFRKMLRSWVETQATWNIYSTGNNWTTAGGIGAGTDRVATPVASLSNVGSTLQFYTITDSTGAAGGLLDTVRDWVDRSAANNGFHNERDGVADNRFWTWTASEGTNGNRPYMSINYTVVVGTITVTQPFSNDSFFPGETVPVRWQTSNVSGGLDITLSRDGGTSYLETLATNFPYTGVDFGWLVTTGTCSACMIKVTSVNDPTVIGLSAPFRVRGTSLRLR
jgi:parallel beta helix pectate lyase-like protein